MWAFYATDTSNYIKQFLICNTCLNHLWRLNALFFNYSNCCTFKFIVTCWKHLSISCHSSLVCTTRTIAFNAFICLVHVFQWFNDVKRKKLALSVCFSKNKFEIFGPIDHMYYLTNYVTVNNSLKRILICFNRILVKLFGFFD